MWLLIGSFQATGRKVIIFTDRADDGFNAHLNFGPVDGEDSMVSIHPTAAALTFDLEQALSPWSSFRNKEAVSEFEASQLNLILKKFVKSIVMRASHSNATGHEAFSFEKLLNVTTNLTKTHTSIMQKHAKKLNQPSEATMYPFYGGSVGGRQPSDETAGILYKPIDVNYNFIRSLFLDKVLDN